MIATIATQTRPAAPEVGGEFAAALEWGAMPCRRRSRARAMLAAIRPHQWTKNALVLLPLFLAHQMLDGAKLAAGLLSFAAFCCCASAVYVLNDLLDVEADRRHPTKCRRPLAAGELSPAAALVLAACLAAAAFGLASLLVSWRLCGLLATYLALTTAYSLCLKRQLSLDVILLAGLYTFRIVAGAMAVDVRLSPWLLAFSMFFFLSLALGKRTIELATLAGKSMAASGRGYRSEDAQLLESIGPTSGYLAVLVFCLYIDSDVVASLYPNAWLLWLVCPVLLYWITRFWLLAKRRLVADDPVLFALKDRASLCAIAATAALVLAASA
jgi:4-hydroxybenzoate polyprenyltransferase